MSLTNNEIDDLQSRLITIRSELSSVKRKIEGCSEEATKDLNIALSSTKKAVDALEDLKMIEGQITLFDGFDLDK